jgi:hypothetical protein
MPMPFKVRKANCVGSAMTSQSLAEEFPQELRAVAGIVFASYMRLVVWEYLRGAGPL